MKNKTQEYIDPHPMVMDSHSRPRSIPWEIRDA